MKEEEEEDHHLDYHGNGEGRRWGRGEESKEKHLHSLPVSWSSKTNVIRDGFLMRSKIDYEETIMGNKGEKAIVESDYGGAW